GRDPDGPRNAGRRSLESRAASQKRSANPGHPDHRHVRACDGERAQDGLATGCDAFDAQTDRIRESGRDHSARDRALQIDVRSQISHWVHARASDKPSVAFVGMQASEATPDLLYLVRDPWPWG